MRRTIDTADLGKPAQRVARRVAIVLLDDAHRGARRYRRHDGDPGRLHEFRVAIRRLRGWMQLWHFEHEKRVRRIAHATRSARDRDVRCEWLARQHAVALIERLKQGREKADTEAQSAAKELELDYNGLRRHLKQYAGADGSFGVALAAVVAEASDTLQARLHAIRSPRSHAAIHEARIAAKQLRYLLEPVPRTRQLVQQLRVLQDITGALHDAHVFATEQELPAVLLRRLRARSARAYARLERGWLSGGAAPFFTRVHSIGRAVRLSARS